MNAPTLQDVPDIEQQLQREIAEAEAAIAKKRELAKSFAMVNAYIAELKTKGLTVPAPQNGEGENEVIAQEPMSVPTPQETKTVATTPEATRVRRTRERDGSLNSRVRDAVASIPPNTPFSINEVMEYLKQTEVFPPERRNVNWALLGLATAKEIKVVEKGGGKRPSKYLTNDDEWL